jgi:ABC-type branched-subunit amino acid transport system substrate-binding protein
MKRQPWLKLCAGLAAGALVATSCGGDKSDDSDDDDTDAGGAAEVEPVDGFDGETIKLGVLTPTSGTVAVIGDPLTAGNQAYVDYVNEELGGIAGEYPIELVVEDSAYDPSVASQAYPAMRDETVMFLQILGTPVVDALLGDLEADDVVAGPASLDSFWVREPNLMPIGAPYQIQAINGIDWYYNEGGGEGETLCTLASDDAYGDAGVAGVEFIADELGIEIASQATFPAPSAERPAQNFAAQISQLEGDGCEVVWLVSTPTDSGPFATALVENPEFNPTVLGQSPTWLELVAGDMDENWYIVAEGPAYGDESVEGMAELIRIQEEYSDQDPDIYFGFGYNQAQAATQILEKAVELGDLSREGIMEATEEVGTLSFGGLQGDYEYGPADDRVPPTTSTIFTPNPELGGAEGTGLELVAQDYEAEVAGDFEFE